MIKYFAEKLNEEPTRHDMIISFYISEFDKNFKITLEKSGLSSCRNKINTVLVHKWRNHVSGYPWHMNMTPVSLRRQSSAVKRERTWLSRT